MSGHLRPPAPAQLFVECLVTDSGLREAVIGDLAEEYHAIAIRSSPRAAAAWYWSQLLRSALPLCRMSMAGGGPRAWMRLLGAAILGYAALATLVVGTDVILGRLLREQSGDWRMPAASLAVGALCGLVAGYVAAFTGGRAAMASALALGAACTLISVLSLLAGGDGTPLWYQMGLAIIVLPSVVGGALVRAARVRRRAHFNQAKEGR